MSAFDTTTNETRYMIVITTLLGHIDISFCASGVFPKSPSMMKPYLESRIFTSQINQRGECYIISIIVNIVVIFCNTEKIKGSDGACKQNKYQLCGWYKFSPTHTYTTVFIVSICLIIITGFDLMLQGCQIINNPLLFNNLVEQLSHQSRARVTFTRALCLLQN